MRVAANWTHLDNPSIDQLHAIVFPQDPNVGHSMVFVDCELTVRRLGSHLPCSASLHA